MSRVRIIFAALSMGLLIPAGAMALDLGQVQINGFASQGYLWSNKNNYLVTSTGGGSFQLNEMGLVVQSQVTDKLRVGAQMLSRDLGRDGNNMVKLDWGYGDYHYADYLGIRLGKVKLPYGLYNEGRDSDFLRPMVFLPQGIYSENKRDILVAYQGLGLYGNVPLGPVGDMDYHVYLGTVNFSDDSVFMSNIKRNATTMVTSKKTGIVTNILTGVELNNDYIAGGTVTFNPPVPGLKLGASYMTVRNDMSYSYTDPNLPPTSQTATFTKKGAYDNRASYVGFLEYTHGDLAVATEYQVLQHRNELFPAPKNAYDQEAYYGLISYSLDEKVCFSILYDVHYQNMDDRQGKLQVLQNKLPYQNWVKDLGIGVRYNINPNWLIKAEYHTVDGAEGMEAVANGTLRRYWDYVAVKSSFNF